MGTADTDGGSLTYGLHDWGDGRGLAEVVTYLPCRRPEAALYLLHGAGYGAEAFLGAPGRELALKRRIDALVASGAIPPLLVVCPTWSSSTDERSCLRDAEALPRLLPALVAHEEGAFGAAGPGRRVLAGFSSGALATWCALPSVSGLFRGFVPMSACWPQGLADDVARAVGGLPGPAPTVIAACGERDRELPGMERQVAWLRQRVGASVAMRVCAGAGHEHGVAVDALAFALPELLA